MVLTILTYIGIILTLGFGLYTIWITKKSNRKVSLGLEKKECYSLFKKDINRLNIDIIYQDKSINNYLILFKGILINNGKVDIDKSRIYKDLKIKTNANYKWLEATIVEQPTDSLFLIDKIDDITLELKWDLLKVNEKIEFESLIEIPKESHIEIISDDFYNSLKFDFRITDLNSIQKLSEINTREKKIKKLRRKSLFMGILSIIMGMFLFFSLEFHEKLPFPIGIKRVINYELIYHNDTIQGKLTPLYNNRIRIKNKNIEVDKKIGEFNNDVLVNKIIDIPISNFEIIFNKIIGIIMFALGVLMLFLLFNLSKKRKKSFK